MTQTGSVAEGRLSDWISLGVLASWVPRDAVDDAVEATGKGAKRKGGKLPPHVMVYFAMALALFAGEDYEETWTRLSETLADWGCWDDSQGAVTTGGLTTWSGGAIGAGGGGTFNNNGTFDIQANNSWVSSFGGNSPRTRKARSWARGGR